MSTEKDKCRYCQIYIWNDHTYSRSGYHCCINCINLADKIFTYYSKKYKKCLDCSHIIVDYNRIECKKYIYYTLCHHCSIPIKNKYMNINIL